jgi:hypothetical protein
MDNSLEQLFSTALEKMSESKRKIDDETSDHRETEFAGSKANILAIETEKRYGKNFWNRPDHGWLAESDDGFNFSPLLRRRDVVTLFMFFAYMVAIILRSNLSMALVDMTSPRKITLSNGTEITIVGIIVQYCITCNYCF